MTYILKEEKYLKKFAGILAFLGTGAVTGSVEAASTVKDKVEKVIGYFDDDTDKGTISGIIENIVGEAWEEVCQGYDLPIECRKELTNYNIGNSLDDWDSIGTIRLNIVRICKNNNVPLSKIHPNEMARKLLRGINSRIDDNVYLTTRSSLHAILTDTDEIKQKLDEIMQEITSKRGSDPGVYGRLMERFLIEIDNHPSITSDN